jgi:hypothetical protein
MLGNDLRWGTEKERVESCTAEGGKWGKKGRNDLKIGPRTAQLECVRMYIIAFDRTRAWRMWCKRAQRSNLQGKFERKCA